MVKKLTRHGNSMALVLDKPVLALLNIEPDTPLDITTDGNALLVSPVRDPKRRAKFQRALLMANRKYGRALRRLAR
jgi:antitoxin component of MazEF toxin-antitoxin module